MRRWRPEHEQASACSSAAMSFADREDGEYFAEKVQPLLNRDGVSHRFLGPMETERRQRLLARAKCLLLSSPSAGDDLAHSDGGSLRRHAGHRLPFRRSR